MALQQITIHKPLRALCRRFNVLVKAVSLLFKVSAAAWIINSLELCRREDLNHAWKMVSGAPRCTHLRQEILLGQLLDGEKLQKSSCGEQCGQQPRTRTGLHWNLDLLGYKHPQPSKLFTSWPVFTWHGQHDPVSVRNSHHHFSVTGLFPSTYGNRDFGCDHQQIQQN